MIARLLICLSFAVVPVLLPALAAAQDDGPDLALAPLSSADAGRGWEGVGRLHIGDDAFCTASLISPTQVLTAAHCLFDGTTGARVPDRALEFRAGYRAGRADAYSRVRRSLVLPDYVPGKAGRSGQMASDLALIELANPIRKPGVQPFAVAPSPAKGDAVQVVSYALGRQETPSIQKRCHVLGRAQAKGQDAPAQVFSCDVDFGSSGAPIFSLSEGRPRIVSVVSAKARMDGKPVALAAPVAEGLALLQSEMARSDGVFHRRARPVQASDRAADLAHAGAKFLRP